MVPIPAKAKYGPWALGIQVLIHWRANRDNDDAAIVDCTIVSCEYQSVRGFCEAPRQKFGAALFPEGESPIFDA